MSYFAPLELRSALSRVAAGLIVASADGDRENAVLVDGSGGRWTYPVAELTEALGALPAHVEDQDLAGERLNARVSQIIGAIEGELPAARDRLDDRSRRALLQSQADDEARRGVVPAFASAQEALAGQTRTASAQETLLADDVDQSTGGVAVVDRPDPASGGSSAPSEGPGSGADITVPTQVAPVEGG